MTVRLPLQVPRVEAAPVTTQPASAIPPLPREAALPGAHPALPPVPPDPGMEASSLWAPRASTVVTTQGAHCHCLALFKGNAVGFLCRVLRKLTIEKSCMFLLGQVFLTSFVIRVPFQALNLQLCGELFCNRRSSLGDWAAFNKVYVCILPYVISACFSSKFRHPEEAVPLYTHT